MHLIRRTLLCRLPWPAAALFVLAACASDDANPVPPSGNDPDINDASGNDSTPVEPSSPVDETTTTPSEVSVIEGARISSQPDDPNFHRVRGTLQLAGSYADARLRIELGTTCYPFEGWRDLEIPEGHRWPSSCDAYDRNFEILMRQVNAPEDQPLFEVERAITPFGGPMTLDVDITDLANARPGEWELIVHISTWSDGAGQVSGSNGGWDIDAFLQTLPGAPPRPILDVVPLFDGQLTHEHPGIGVSWTTDEAVRSARVEVRTTGHGGASDPSVTCIGPAEEFCRRWHSGRLDGQLVFQEQPWRDDCATLCTRRPLPGGGDQQYCAENPCGAIRSVEAPRANWCPGAVTPPIVLEHEALATPGERELTWEVGRVYPGGSWRTNVMLYLYGE